MRKVKYAVVYNYIRTGNLTQKGNASILIRAYLNGKNRYFNTSIYVKPKQWDDKNKRVINHPNQYQLNSSIRAEIDKMEAFEYEIIKRGEAISLQRLGDYSNALIDLSFTDFIEQHLNNQTGTRSSYTDQRQTLDKLKEFKPVIYFNDLSFKLVNGFDSFLFNQKKLHTNTVAKHHKNLKKYINLAIRYDLLDVNRNPYKKFKVKREPTERVFLTNDELTKFESFEAPTDQVHLALIKDLFLFCCYTGLRYSDVSRITRKNISVTTGGIELYLKAQKTKKLWHYNLRNFFKTKEKESKPELIIKRRLIFQETFFGEHPIFDSEPLFGELTNQHVNRELKKIARHINVRPIVQERISIHSGRHTFGTIMAGKIPVQVLQKLMQHSKVKETMIYVHLNKQAIANILENIEW